MNPLKKAMMRADELRAKGPEALAADSHEVAWAPSPPRSSELDPAEVAAACREKTVRREMPTVCRVSRDGSPEAGPRPAVRSVGTAEQPKMGDVATCRDRGSVQPEAAAPEISDQTWAPVFPEHVVAPVAGRAEGLSADATPRPRLWPGKLLLRGALEGPTRVLRTRILDRLDGNGAGSLLVTSPNPGEGKSVTALHLAASFAQELKRPTVLVAADFRRRAPWGNGGGQVAGLANYLTGQADPESILFESEIPNLGLVPVGWWGREAPALLSTESLGALLDQIQRIRPGAFVIFDGPSARGTADTLLLAQLVQGVIMVVAAESTPYRDLLTSAAHIGDREKLLGVVYTKARDPHL